MFQRILTQTTPKHSCDLNGSTFIIFINHCAGSCIGKRLLVVHKIVRVFFNTLTVDDKHYLVNRDKLAQPIQVQLSRKQKAFSKLFFAFLKSILNFQHLLKKDDLQR